MTDDESREETLTSDEGEEAATGRRWWLSLAMIAVGLVLVASGALSGQTLLIPCGIVLVLAFGYIAAGCSGIDVSGPLGIRARAPLPRKAKRRKIVKKSGFEKQGRSPADPHDPDK